MRNSDEFQSSHFSYDIVEEDSLRSRWTEP